MGLLLTMKTFPLTRKDKIFTNYLKDLNNIPYKYAVINGYSALQENKKTYYVHLKRSAGYFKYTNFYLPLKYRGRDVTQIYLNKI